MNDEVIGISVLQPIWAQGFYRLWITCRRRDGQKSQTFIWARDREHSHLGDKIPNYEGKIPLWKFRRNGPHMLVVEPSVNYISFNFHNGTPWFTEVIELSYREELNEDKDKLPTHRIGSRVHHEINLCQCQEDVDRYVAELEAANALWQP
jgi:hypothetical protein